MAIGVDEYFKEKKELISDFNEAKLQIFRLNNDWERCATYARSGKLTNWKWELDVVWRELSVDAKHIDEGRENGDKFTTKIEKLDILIARYQKYPNHLYKVLSMKEVILKRLQDEAGKGSKRRKEDEDDIEG